MFLGNLMCAEIGVSAGANAINMLNSLPESRFYLVDSYDVENTTFQFNKKVFTQEEREAFIEETKQRLSPYQSRVVLMIEDSVEASKKFKDEFFDYVYIDAQHEYEAVKRDIDAWYSKVRKGGILGGHDIGSEGVNQAVRERFPEALAVGEDWYIYK